MHNEGVIRLLYLPSLSGGKGWNYKTLRIHIPCYLDGNYLHPCGRTIQSITVISFDPLAAVCLLKQGNKFNLDHAPIGSVTNSKGSSKTLMKCYYAE